MATFGTFVSGQVLTAGELNSAGAWQDYTPSWTQSATITKTVNWARYTQLNKLVIGSIKMTATAAGTANNKILIGLPVNASANNFVIGTLIVFENTGTASYAFDPKACIYESASTMAFSPTGAAATTTSSTTDVRMGQNYSGSSTGYTIVSGDIFWVQFMYEAA